MSRNLEQGRATRQELVAAATREFAVRGYEATSLDAILAATGVSRGALYHHFTNKAELFEAVLEETEASIAAAIVAAAQKARTPEDALRLGCDAWLAVAQDPATRRIALIDAPVVVGWALWREMDGRHGFGLLKGALQAVAADGVIDAGQVDVFAHMLLAALLEVALVLARDAHSRSAARDAKRAVDTLLDRLLGKKR